MVRPDPALAMEKVGGAHSPVAQEASFCSHFPFLVVRFIFQTQRAGRLGPYLPSALRGALGEVLLAQQCSVDPLSCEICEETPYCALRCLFAAESPDQGPAPFVIDAPLHHQADFDAGTIFSFHLTLFGRSIELFPAVFRAFEEVAARGLQKGRLTCRFLGAEQVYEGTMTPETSSVSSVTLEFQTPLRIKADEKMLGVGELDFAVFWRRLRGRLKMLGEAHCGLRLEADHFPPVPKNVSAVSRNLRWAHLQNYSFRQRQRNSLSGLVGTITFAGELGPYLPYLRLGEIIHVGSGCVYGLGRYRLIVNGAGQ